MFELICDVYYMLVSKNQLREQLNNNPNLGFEFTYLYYQPAKNKQYKIIGLEQIDLSEDEINIIEEFCNNYPFKVWRYDQYYNVIEQTTVDKCNDSLYAHCPPPNARNVYFWYNTDTYNWDYIYGIDIDGVYIGNVPASQCVYFATGPRPFAEYFRWNPETKEWFDSRDFEEIRQEVMEFLQIRYDDINTNGLLFKGIEWSNRQQDIDSLLDSKNKSNSWVDIDGDIQQFEGFVLKDIQQAIRDYYENLNNYFAELRVQIQAAKTIEELRAIEVK